MIASEKVVKNLNWKREQKQLSLREMGYRAASWPHFFVPLKVAVALLTLAFL